MRARIEQVTPENGVSALFNSTVTVECKATGSPFPNLNFERVDGKGGYYYLFRHISIADMYGVFPPIELAASIIFFDFFKC